MLRPFSEQGGFDPTAFIGIRDADNLRGVDI
jgi:hypothetical protein